MSVHVHKAVGSECLIESQLPISRHRRSEHITAPHCLPLFSVGALAMNLKARCRLFALGSRVSEHTGELAGRRLRSSAEVTLRADLCENRVFLHKAPKTAASQQLPACIQLCPTLC
jgi:hypothetical protein